MLENSSHSKTKTRFTEMLTSLRTQVGTMQVFCPVLPGTDEYKQKGNVCICEMIYAFIRVFGDWFCCDIDHKTKEGWKFAEKSCILRIFVIRLLAWNNFCRKPDDSLISLIKPKSDTRPTYHICSKINESIPMQWLRYEPLCLNVQKFCILPIHVLCVFHLIL
jgi:hypothetical protein